MNSDTCSICFVNLNNEKTNTTTITSCHHLFHDDCLQSWLSYGNITCPICRCYVFDDDFVDFVHMFHYDLEYAFEDVSKYTHVIQFMHSRYKEYIR